MSPAEILALVDALVDRGISATDAADITAAAARGAHDPDRLLTASEVARLTGRSERTVERWMAEETVPTVKAGGKAVGIHWPTFLAVCTTYTQPTRTSNPVRAGEIAARLASSK